MALTKGQDQVMHTCIYPVSAQEVAAWTYFSVPKVRRLLTSLKKAGHVTNAKGKWARVGPYD